ncbi:hypothetical protein N2152v2_001193 [Parachlorella kessleri]
MLEKAGDRLVVVQFYQAQNYTSMQMRASFQQLSKQPKFKKAIFAEVDLNEAPELGELAGVSMSPTYQCYWRGELRNAYSGVVGLKVQSMIEEAQAEFCSGGGGLARQLFTALAVVGLAAAGVYAARRAGGGEGGTDTSDQMADVTRKLSVAYDRLRLAEKANRVKAALNQRKLIEKLESRKRAALLAYSMLHAVQTGCGSAATAAGAAVLTKGVGQLAGLALERSRQRGAVKGAAAGAAARSAASSRASAASDGYWSDEYREDAGQHEGPSRAGHERVDGRIAYSDEED